MQRCVRPRRVLSSGWIFLIVLVCRITARAPAAEPVQNARELLERIGTNRGICVLVGSPDRTLPLELARRGELLIFVQVSSAAEAASLRQAADEAGLLGKRVYVEEGRPERFPLADDLVDAVIVPGAAARDEVLRILRPGGRAWIGGEEIGKPFPEGADEWSHPYHGPDNNPQSRDTLARGPFLTHFMAEPWYAAMHQVSVFSGGRIFKAFGNRTSAQPQWSMINTLVALNAWNGTLLWKRPLADGFMIHRNTMIATPETLYLGDDTSLKLIDPATGRVRDEIVVPEGLSDGPVWKWMALADGVLYAVVGEKEPKVDVVRGNRFRGAGWPWWKIDKYAFGFGRTVLALDPSDKSVLWCYRDEEPLDSRALCMAGGKIFIYSHQKFLGALDRKTGDLLWKNSDEDMLAAVGEQRPAQRAYWGFASTAFVKATERALYFAGPTQVKLVGVSAGDGRLLFQHPEGNYQIVVRDDAVYALGPGGGQDGGSMRLHPTTGEVLARFRGRIACTRATGSAEFIFVRGGRGGGTSVYDVRKGTPSQGLISPMRPACQDGVVIANGHLYWGPWICRCDTTQIGVINLGPAGARFDFAARAVEAERLERAEDAPRREGPAATDADWPTYRKDNGRTGRSPVAVPRKVSRAWTFRPPGKSVPTAPVAVGETVLVSGADGIVRGIDAATGGVRWTAYTGGGVKFPPSYWKGRVYVGSGDGHVYCLDAATGKRVWRFRAAPAERRIPVHGQLLSTWPVGSGVLVEDGVAYGAAGIANYDGTHVYALDAETGKIRWQNHTSGHLYQERDDSGAGVQGHLLLHDGALYMAGGNLVPVGKYDLESGKFSRADVADRRQVQGKDLYVLNGEVRSTGYPLYWRQEDQHFITNAGFPASGGTISVVASRVGLLGSRRDDKGNPRLDWGAKPFQEISAVAIGKNAVVLAGVDRAGVGDDVRTTSGICALDLASGTQLWLQPLPAPPVAFGVAIDRDGHILVSLQDGRVLCFAAGAL